MCVFSLVIPAPPLIFCLLFFVLLCPIWPTSETCIGLPLLTQLVVSALCLSYVRCFCIVLLLAHQLDIGLIKPANGSLVPSRRGLRPERMFVFVACLFSHLFFCRLYTGAFFFSVYRFFFPVTFGLEICVTEWYAAASTAALRNGVLVLRCMYSFVAGACL